MSSENRKYPRKKVDHIAHVKLPIRLLDISRSGARVSVDDATKLPDEFVLQISAGLARWCRVKWRDREQMGLEFIDPRETVPSTALGSPIPAQ
jgi:PilZ domain